MNNKTIFSKVYLFSIVFMIVLCSYNIKEKDWYINATYYEACSCNAPCPCPYGLPMTNSFCRLNSYIDIHESRYKNTDLSGLKVILSGGSGEAGEFFIANPVTDKQVQAFQELIQVINPGSFKKISFGGIVPIHFENKNGHIKYSSKSIKVELETVLGNNNSPIKVSNLKGKIFNDYSPHLAKLSIRNSTDTTLTKSFKYENKAGFRAYWELSDTDYK